MSGTNGSRATSSVKDVAALARVSLGTVSNVLNRPERVSAGTRQRVEQAMAGSASCATSSRASCGWAPAARSPT